MKRAIQAALLAVTMAAGAQAADKVTTVPVQFAKGAHSAQLKGSFTGYDTIHYTLVAKAGQTMTVKIGGSSNANFNVFAPAPNPARPRRWAATMAMVSGKAPCPPPAST